MLYNKREVRKVNDKKVLHKVKKQWVTISLALLMAIGGGAAATHVNASANKDTGNNSSNTEITRMNNNLKQTGDNHSDLYDARNTARIGDDNGQKNKPVYSIGASQPLSAKDYATAAGADSTAANNDSTAAANSSKAINQDQTDINTDITSASALYKLESALSTNSDDYTGFSNALNTDDKSAKAMVNTASTNETSISGEVTTIAGDATNASNAANNNNRDVASNANMSASDVLNSSIVTQSNKISSAKGTADQANQAATTTMSDVNDAISRLRTSVINKISDEAATAKGSANATNTLSGLASASANEAKNDSVASSASAQASYYSNASANETISGFVNAVNGDKGQINADNNSISNSATDASNKYNDINQQLTNAKNSESNDSALASALSAANADLADINTDYSTVSSASGDINKKSSSIKTSDTDAQGKLSNLRNSAVAQIGSDSTTAGKSANGVKVASTSADGDSTKAKNSNALITSMSADVADYKNNADNQSVKGDVDTAANAENKINEDGNQLTKDSTSASTSANDIATQSKNANTASQAKNDKSLANDLNTANNDSTNVQSDANDATTKSNDIGTQSDAINGAYTDTQTILNSLRGSTSTQISEDAEQASNSADKAATSSTYANTNSQNASASNSDTASLSSTTLAYDNTSANTNFNDYATDAARAKSTINTDTGTVEKAYSDASNAASDAKIQKANVNRDSGNDSKLDSDLNAANSDSSKASSGYANISGLAQDISNESGSINADKSNASSLYTSVSNSAASRSASASSSADSTSTQNGSATSSSNDLTGDVIKLTSTNSLFSLVNRDASAYTNFDTSISASFSSYSTAARNAVNIYNDNSASASSAISVVNSENMIAQQASVNAKSATTARHFSAAYSYEDTINSAYSAANDERTSVSSYTSIAASASGSLDNVTSEATSRFDQANSLVVATPNDHGNSDNPNDFDAMVVLYDKTKGPYLYVIQGRQGGSLSLGDTTYTHVHADPTTGRVTGESNGKVYDLDYCASTIESPQTRMDANVNTETEFKYDDGNGQTAPDYTELTGGVTQESTDPKRKNVFMSTQHISGYKGEPYLIPQQNVYDDGMYPHFTPVNAPYKGLAVIGENTTDTNENGQNNGDGNNNGDNDNGAYWYGSRENKNTRILKMQAKRYTTQIVFTYNGHKYVVKYQTPDSNFKNTDNYTKNSSTNNAQFSGLGPVTYGSGNNQTTTPGDSLDYRDQFNNAQEDGTGFHIPTGLQIAEPGNPIQFGNDYEPNGDKNAPYGDLSTPGVQTLTVPLEPSKITINAPVVLENYKSLTDSKYASTNPLKPVFASVPVYNSIYDQTNNPYLINRNVNYNNPDADGGTLNGMSLMSEGHIVNSAFLNYANNQPLGKWSNIGGNQTGNTQNTAFVDGNSNPDFSDVGATEENVDLSKGQITNQTPQQNPNVVQELVPIIYYTPQPAGQYNEDLTAPDILYNYRMWMPNKRDSQSIQNYNSKFVNPANAKNNSSQTTDDGISVNSDTINSNDLNNYENNYNGDYNGKGWNNDPKQDPNTIYSSDIDNADTNNAYNFQSYQKNITFDAGIDHALVPSGTIVVQNPYLWGSLEHFKGEDPNLPENTWAFRMIKTTPSVNGGNIELQRLAIQPGTGGNTFVTLNGKNKDTVTYVGLANGSYINGYTIAPEKQQGVPVENAANGFKVTNNNTHKSQWYPQNVAILWDNNGGNFCKYNYATHTGSGTGKPDVTFNLANGTYDDSNVLNGFYSFADGTPIDFDVSNDNESGDDGRIESELNSQYTGQYDNDAHNAPVNNGYSADHFYVGDMNAYAQPMKYGVQFLGSQNFLTNDGTQLQDTTSFPSPKDNGNNNDEFYPEFSTNSWQINPTTNTITTIVYNSPISNTETDRNYDFQHHQITTTITDTSEDPQTLKPTTKVTVNKSPMSQTEEGNYYQDLAYANDVITYHNVGYKNSVNDQGCFTIDRKTANGPDSIQLLSIPTYTGNQAGDHSLIYDPDYEQSYLSDLTDTERNQGHTINMTNNDEPNAVKGEPDASKGTFTWTLGNGNIPLNIWPDGTTLNDDTNAVVFLADRQIQARNKIHFVDLDTGYQFNDNQVHFTGGSSNGTLMSLFNDVQTNTKNGQSKSNKSVFDMAGFLKQVVGQEGSKLQSDGTWKLETRLSNGDDADVYIVRTDSPSKIQLLNNTYIYVSTVDLGSPDNIGKFDFPLTINYEDINGNPIASESDMNAAQKSMETYAIENFNSARSLSASSSFTSMVNSENSANSSYAGETSSYKSTFPTEPFPHVPGSGDYTKPTSMNSDLGAMSGAYDFLVDGALGNTVVDAIKGKNTTTGSSYDTYYNQNKSQANPWWDYTKAGYHEVYLIPGPYMSGKDYSSYTSYLNQDLKNSYVNSQPDSLAVVDNDSVASAKSIGEVGHTPDMTIVLAQNPQVQPYYVYKTDTGTEEKYALTNGSSDANLNPVNIAGDMGSSAGSIISSGASFGDLDIASGTPFYDNYLKLGSYESVASGPYSGSSTQLMNVNSSYSGPQPIYVTAPGINVHYQILGQNSDLNAPVHFNNPGPTSSFDINNYSDGTNASSDANWADLNNLRAHESNSADSGLPSGYSTSFDSEHYSIVATVGSSMASLPANANNEVAPTSEFTYSHQDVYIYLVPKAYAQVHFIDDTAKDGVKDPNDTNLSNYDPQSLMTTSGSSAAYDPTASLNALYASGYQLDPNPVSAGSNSNGSSQISFSYGASGNSSFGNSYTNSSTPYFYNIYVEHKSTAKSSGVSVNEEIHYSFATSVNGSSLNDSGSITSASNSLPTSYRNSVSYNNSYNIDKIENSSYDFRWSSNGSFSNVPVSSISGWHATITSFNGSSYGSYNNNSSVASPKISYSDTNTSVSGSSFTAASASMSSGIYNYSYDVTYYPDSYSDYANATDKVTYHYLNVNGSNVAVPTSAPSVSENNSLSYYRSEVWSSGSSANAYRATPWSATSGYNSFFNSINEPDISGYHVVNSFDSHVTNTSIPGNVSSLHLVSASTTSFSNDVYYVQDSSSEGTDYVSAQNTVQYLIANGYSGAGSSIAASSMSTLKYHRHDSYDSYSSGNIDHRKHSYGNWSASGASSFASDIEPENISSNGIYYHRVDPSYDNPNTSEFAASGVNDTDLDSAYNSANPDWSTTATDNSNGIAKYNSNVYYAPDSYNANSQTATVNIVINYLDMNGSSMANVPSESTSAVTYTRTNSIDANGNSAANHYAQWKLSGNGFGSLPSSADVPNMHPQSVSNLGNSTAQSLSANDNSLSSVTDNSNSFTSTITENVYYSADTSQTYTDTTSAKDTFNYLSEGNHSDAIQSASVDSVVYTRSDSENTYSSAGYDHIKHSTGNWSVSSGSFSNYNVPNNLESNGIYYTLDPHAQGTNSSVTAASSVSQDDLTNAFLSGSNSGYASKVTSNVTNGEYDLINNVYYRQDSSIASSENASATETNNYTWNSGRSNVSSAASVTTFEYTRSVEKDTTTGSIISYGNWSLSKSNHNENVNSSLSGYHFDHTDHAMEESNGSLADSLTSDLIVGSNISYSETSYFVPDSYTSDGQTSQSASATIMVHYVSAGDHTNSLDTASYSSTIDYTRSVFSDTANGKSNNKYDSYGSWVANHSFSLVSSASISGYYITSSLVASDTMPNSSLTNVTNQGSYVYDEDVYYTPDNYKDIGSQSATGNITVNYLSSGNTDNSLGTSAYSSAITYTRFVYSDEVSGKSGSKYYSYGPWTSNYAFSLSSSASIFGYHLVNGNGQDSISNGLPQNLNNVTSGSSYNYVENVYYASDNITPHSQQAWGVDTVNYYVAGTDQLLSTSSTSSKGITYTRFYDYDPTTRSSVTDRNGSVIYTPWSTATEFSTVSVPSFITASGSNYYYNSLDSSNNSVTPNAKSNSSLSSLNSGSTASFTNDLYYLPDNYQASTENAKGTITVNYVSQGNHNEVFSTYSSQVNYQRSMFKDIENPNVAPVYYSWSANDSNAVPNSTLPGSPTISYHHLASDNNGIYNGSANSTNNLPTSLEPNDISNGASYAYNVNVYYALDGSMNTSDGVNASNTVYYYAGTNSGDSEFASPSTESIKFSRADSMDTFYHFHSYGSWTSNNSFSAASAPEDVLLNGQYYHLVTTSDDLAPSISSASLTSAYDLVNTNSTSYSGAGSSGTIGYSESLYYEPDSAGDYSSFGSQTAKGFVTVRYVSQSAETVEFSSSTSEINYQRYKYQDVHSSGVYSYAAWSANGKNSIPSLSFQTNPSYSNYHLVGSSSMTTLPTSLTSGSISSGSIYIYDRDVYYASDSTQSLSETAYINENIRYVYSDGNFSTTASTTPQTIRYQRPAEYDPVTNEYTSTGDWVLSGGSFSVPASASMPDWHVVGSDANIGNYLAHHSMSSGDNGLYTYNVYYAPDNWTSQTNTSSATATINYVEADLMNPNSSSVVATNHLSAVPMSQAENSNANHPDLTGYGSWVANSGFSIPSSMSIAGWTTVSSGIAIGGSIPTSAFSVASGQPANYVMNVYYVQDPSALGSNVVPATDTVNYLISGTSSAISSASTGMTAYSRSDSYNEVTRAHSYGSWVGNSFASISVPTSISFNGISYHEVSADSTVPSVTSDALDAYSHGNHGATSYVNDIYYAPDSSATSTAVVNGTETITYLLSASGSTQTSSVYQNSVAYSQVYSLDNTTHTSVVAKPWTESGSFVNVTTPSLQYWSADSNMVAAPSMNTSSNANFSYNVVYVHNNAYYQSSAAQSAANSAKASTANSIKASQSASTSTSNSISASQSASKSASASTSASLSASKSASESRAASQSASKSASAGSSILSQSSSSASQSTPSSSAKKASSSASSKAAPAKSAKANGHRAPTSAEINRDIKHHHVTSNDADHMNPRQLAKTKRNDPRQYPKIARENKLYHDQLAKAKAKVTKRISQHIRDHRITKHDAVHMNSQQLKQTKKSDPKAYPKVVHYRKVAEQHVIGQKLTKLQKTSPKTYQKVVKASTKLAKRISNQPVKTRLYRDVIQHAAISVTPHEMDYLAVHSPKIYHKILAEQDMLGVNHFTTPLARRAETISTQQMLYLKQHNSKLYRKIRAEQDLLGISHMTSKAARNYVNGINAARQGLKLYSHNGAFAKGYAAFKRANGGKLPQTGDASHHMSLTAAVLLVLSLTFSIPALKRRKRNE